MLFQFAAVDFFKPNFTFSAEYTLYQLSGTHLQTEKSYRSWFGGMKGGTTGKVQRKSCFTYRWPCCQDDQIGRLPTVSQLIQRWKTTGNTSNIFVPVTHILNALDGFYQNRIDIIEIFAQVIVGNFKEFA